MKGDRPGAGRKSVGERHSRQQRQDLGKWQILAEGEQYLLMITAENPTVGVSKKSRVERFRAGTIEPAEKTLGAKNKSSLRRFERRHQLRRQSRQIFRHHDFDRRLRPDDQRGDVSLFNREATVGFEILLCQNRIPFKVDVDVTL